MWTLAEAVEFVKLIQEDCRKNNYHVCLGGGVLNKGQSFKDLDLYFLPLEDESDHPDDRRNWTPLSVMSIMFRLTGGIGRDIHESYSGVRSTYRQKLQYKWNGKLIDCFIM